MQQMRHILEPCSDNVLLAGGCAADVPDINNLAYLFFEPLPANGVLRSHQHRIVLVEVLRRMLQQHVSQCVLIRLNLFQ